jgi:hypothetical protein
LFSLIQKIMLKRNRTTSILLLPLAVLLWFMGWGIYWAGWKKEQTRNKPRLAVQRELVMFVPNPEQQYAT